MVILKAAIEAVEENRNLEEALVGALARLASVVDRDEDVLDRVLEIVSAGACRTSITQGIVAKKRAFVLLIRETA